MATDVLGQTLTIGRGEDVSIVLSGPFSEDPTSWTMQFSVAKQRGQTPVLTITSVTIAGGAGTYTATIPITRAQSSALLLDQFDWDLFRTNAGSVSVKAGGSLQVITPVYPPVA